MKLFQKLLREYSAIVKKIDSFIEKENIALIKRLLELHHTNGYDTNNIHKVARVQGLLTKILVENPLFSEDKNSKNFIQIYGERILEIKKETDKIKFLLDALNADTAEITNAFYSNKDKRFVVEVAGAGR